MNEPFLTTEVFATAPPASQLCLERLGKENGTQTRLLFIVVYFAFLLPDGSSRRIVRDQWLDAVACGIVAHAAAFHIVVSADTKEELEWASAELVPMIRAKGGIVHIVEQNMYEFPGIHLVWQLACKRPECVYLYFHSKGVMHTNHGGRVAWELPLFYDLVVGWRPIMDIFEHHAEVRAIGYPGKEAGENKTINGVLWFNFWWVRGTHLHLVEEPLLTSRRHYYEEWMPLRVVDVTESVEKARRLARESDLCVDAVFVQKGEEDQCAPIDDDATALCISTGKFEPLTMSQVAETVLARANVLGSISTRSLISATYGTFTKFFHVTELVANTFVKNGRLIVPAGCNFNAYFGDPAPGELKYLSINSGLGIIDVAEGLTHEFQHSLYGY
jgi:hypothetical protein